MMTIEFLHDGKVIATSTSYDALAWYCSKERLNLMETLFKNGAPYEELIYEDEYLDWLWDVRMSYLKDENVDSSLGMFDFVTGIAYEVLRKFYCNQYAEGADGPEPLTVKITGTVDDIAKVKKLCETEQ